MSYDQEATAREIMSSPVVSLDRETTLDQAVQILTDGGYGGAPVVDARGEPVGVVSLFDIAVYLAGRDRRLGRLAPMLLASQQRVERGRDEALDELEEDEDEALEVRVDDVMTPRVVTVGPDTPVSVVARALASEGIHRVIVKSEGGPPLGIVTSLDILRAQSGVARVRTPT